MTQESLGRGWMAIVTQEADFAIARDQHWYRIPVSSLKHHLKRRWPPQWIAFYLPKVFGPEAYSIRYYAQVLQIQEVSRLDLFPDQRNHKKAQKRYYKLDLSPLEQLPKPIPSRKFRRITFIPTTWEKLIKAEEINDLWDDSPLEDQLWAELKHLNIDAERQYEVNCKRASYRLDFAIHCTDGKINIETDGDTWHANPKKSLQDNLRDNDLETLGWRTIRFNTHHIKEEMGSYCIPTIAENIRRLGGLKVEDQQIPRFINVQASEASEQLTLF